VPKTGYSQETHSARRFPAGLPSPSLAKLVGWTLFEWCAGRFIALTVCRLMNHNLEKARGLPTLISQNGVVKLWRIDRFAEISCSPAEQWVLDDGARLDPGDPVFEFHIAGEPFIKLLRMTNWRTAIRQEFRSLAPLLDERSEVALVGTTILRRQVAEFGASLRELPPGLHRSFDSFYRKLILLALHPGGAKRVLSQTEPVAEAAISIREFCRRYREPLGASSSTRNRYSSRAMKAQVK
jgi:hypothetical protein